MAHTLRRISIKALSSFLSELSIALNRKGLDYSHLIMEKYGIGYSTKYTKGRYVLDQIIRGLDIHDFLKNGTPSIAGLNRIKLIEEFLNNGINAKDLDEYGGNLFAAASYSLIPKCYQLLLDHGADPNVVNKLGDSPLSLIWNNLISESYNINKLYFNNLINILTILLLGGADPWQESSSWNIKMLVPAFSILNLSSPGCIDLRKKINPILYNLFLNDSDVSQHNNSSTPQMMECKSEVSQFDAVRAVYSIRSLVRAGSIDEAVNMLRVLFGIGYTTTVANNGQYFMAILIGEMNELLENDKKEQHDHYMTLITRFLDNGVDVNHIDDEGRSILLTIAAFNREPELCKLLLKHGADPRIKPERGYSPIEAAIKSYFFDKGHKTKMKECVSLFLKEKVVINDPIKLVSHSTDGVTRILETDPASQGLIKMFRKYGYLPKEEDEKAGK